MNNLQFHYQPDTTDAEAGMAERLASSLQQHDRVVWMVCGGSSIAQAVACIGRIPQELTGKLTVFLTDERYGVPGHPDSNWTQLFAAGFDGGDATIIPTLQEGLTLEDTCAAYAKTVVDALDQADDVIAQFGIGGDGHIAGILPQSAAVTSTEPVVGYDAGTFTRITLTPPVLERIQAAYAFVFGETKHDALVQLRDQDLSLDDQPSQILKRLPEAHIYTDQIK